MGWPDTINSIINLANMRAIVGANERHQLQKLGGAEDGVPGGHLPTFFIQVCQKLHQLRSYFDERFQCCRPILMNVAAFIRPNIRDDTWQKWIFAGRNHFKARQIDLPVDVA